MISQSLEAEILSDRNLSPNLGRDQVSPSKKKLVKKAEKSIIVPMTMGEKFEQARIKKGLDLIDVEQKTLIRAKYLEALEQSKFYLLPLPVYACGFVQTYATFLGLNSKKLLHQFREEYGMANKASLNCLTIDNRPNTSRLVVTPRMLWGTLILASLAAVVIYLSVQIVGFASAPPLIVDSPVQRSEIVGNTVTVAGTTDPGAAVSIGQQTVAVDGSGNFSESVRVQDGVNTIEVKSTGRSGKSRVNVITVMAKEPHTALGNGQEGKNE